MVHNALSAYFDKITQSTLQITLEYHSHRQGIYASGESKVSNLGLVEQTLIELCFRLLPSSGVWKAKCDFLADISLLAQAIPK